MEKTSITKKQHYVPRMYLRNFCIDGKKDKCYEYNQHTNDVRIANINNLCEENYLYEIRDEEGIFLVPELKNQIEKAFSIIENEDAELLKDLLELIERSRDSIVLSDEQRKSLIGFIFLMILRNPVLMDVLPETLKLINGTELKTKAEIKFAWIIVLLNIDRYGYDIENTQLTFLRTKESNPFITSKLPMYFSGYPIQRDFYMPLSSKVAIEMRLPENVLINVNKCDIRDLSIEEVDSYNCKLLDRQGSIISNSQEALNKYKLFMDDFDKSPINPYTLVNLEMLEKMQPEYFHLLIIKLVNEELNNKNEIFIETYNRLIIDFSSDETKNKMASAIEDEVRKALICNRLLDVVEYKELLDKI
jgi:hypothetical protein